MLIRSQRKCDPRTFYPALLLFKDKGNRQIFFKLKTRTQGMSSHEPLGETTRGQVSTSQERTRETPRKGLTMDIDPFH